MKIAYQNVSGLRHAFSRFQEDLCKFVSENDITVFAETKVADPFDCPVFTSRKIIHKLRCGRGGDICLIASVETEVQEIPLVSDMCVTVKLEADTFSLKCVYNPPRASRDAESDERFFAALGETFDFLETRGKTYW